MQKQITKSASTSSVIIECKYWQRPSGCQRGDTCKFYHDPRIHPGTLKPCLHYDICNQFTYQHKEKCKLCSSSFPKMYATSGLDLSKPITSTTSGLDLSKPITIPKSRSYACLHAVHGCHFHATSWNGKCVRCQVVSTGCAGCEHEKELKPASTSTPTLVSSSTLASMSSSLASTSTSTTPVSILGEHPKPAFFSPHVPFAPYPSWRKYHPHHHPTHYSHGYPYPHQFYPSAPYPAHPPPTHPMGYYHHPPYPSIHNVLHPSSNGLHPSVSTASGTEGPFRSGPTLIPLHVPKPSGTGPVPAQGPFRSGPSDTLSPSLTDIPVSTTTAHVPVSTSTTNVAVSTTTNVAVSTSGPPTSVPTDVSVSTAPFTIHFQSATSLSMASNPSTISSSTATSIVSTSSSTSTSISGSSTTNSTLSSSSTSTSNHGLRIMTKPGFMSSTLSPMSPTFYRDMPWGEAEDDDISGEAEDDDILGEAEDDDILGEAKDDDTLKEAQDDDTLKEAQDDAVLGQTEDTQEKGKQGKLKEKEKGTPLTVTIPSTEEEDKEQSDDDDDKKEILAELSTCYLVRLPVRFVLFC